MFLSEPAESESPTQTDILFSPLQAKVNWCEKEMKSNAKNIKTVKSITYGTSKTSNRDHTAINLHAENDFMEKQNMMCSVSCLWEDKTKQAMHMFSFVSDATTKAERSC